MNRTTRKGRSPAPKKIRTNGDRVMIVIGVCLIIFFLVAGFVGMGNEGEVPTKRKRGPVKNPKALGLLWDREPTGFSLDDLCAAPSGVSRREPFARTIRPGVLGRSGCASISLVSEPVSPRA